MMRKIKVALIGDCGVGKTSIVNRITGLGEMPTTATAGAQFSTCFGKTIEGEEYELALWDTAGAEKYKSIIPMYFRNSDIVVVVFDVNERDTFEHVESWVNLAKEHESGIDNILLVGNKTDLPGVVETSEMANLAGRIGVFGSVQTSALTGDGISAIWDEFGRFVMQGKFHEQPKLALDSRDASQCKC